jgi:phage-related protein
MLGGIGDAVVESERSVACLVRQFQNPLDFCSGKCEHVEGDMPRVEVVFYRENKRSVPMRDWLDNIPRKARAKCLARLERLQELGHELRRPEADYLGDDIYELRVAIQGVNYRMLYFFHGRTASIVSHGIVKEQRVPPREIDLAVERRKRFIEDPAAHSE